MQDQGGTAVLTSASASTEKDAESYITPEDHEARDTSSSPDVSTTVKDHTAEHTADPAAALAELPPELNPRNWSTQRKWVNVSIIAFQATLSPISSTLLAVGQVQIDAELSVPNSQLSAMPVAMYVLGLGLGPLYLAPLSEMYGRRIVYVVNAVVALLTTVGCALVRNDAGLIVLRFIAGLAGGAGPALGGGSIGDLFKREDRGGAQAIYSFGPTFGPTIGGVIGGYIAERAGWRWTMWVCAIGAGITTLATILFLRETYAPYLLARLRGQRSAPPTAGGFTHAITRPLRMLFFAPIATVMSLYVALIYGLLYLQLVTRPLLFGPEPEYGLFTYRWHGGNTGLSYLAAAVGCLFALLASVLTLNRSYRALCRRYGTEKPEFRLPFMQAGMLIAPAGLFMYGWTAEAQTHFIFPLMGAAIFSFGALIVLTCIQTYLVDAFGKYAASGLAASVLLRSVGATVFTIFGTRVYASLGYGWGSSLLGFICISALPIPAILWVYGPRLRAHPFIF
ncbi:MFS general substrate transporter [Obba rivulosa]|uniref:MFS general substrate transporter n=1 Tax=Obba rivulosa TaxID=1052685 RepID=A0A8E2DGK6_9APHY|nr:MFS general substrate transporter [Obba rivulosa]